MPLFRRTRRNFLKTSALVGAASLLVRRLAFASEADDAALVNRVAHDPLRPACHLLSPHNWMNDPNGPIWWKGKYHLFYQLNPEGATWGNMNWGHAVSTDMVHWRHMPPALSPTHGGPDSEGCFSGSAVVHNGVPTFIYTGVQNAPPDQVTIHDGGEKLREVQMLATAEDDDLKRWKKLPDPVIPTPPASIKVTGFRDPCPWKEGDGWYLGVGSGERGKGGCVLLYRSQDLRAWEYLHPLVWGKPNGKQAVNPCDSGEMWECPDFFPLGDRHCLLYSTENKVIWTTGRYDKQAHTYTPEHQGVLDHGAYYAPKSFRTPDGRRILWGWIQERRPEAEYAAAGWAGVMSFPRELTLGPTGQLQMRTAREVETLRGAVERITVDTEKPFRRKLAGLQYELQLPLSMLSHGVATARLLNESKPVWELTVDIPANQVRSGEAQFPLPSHPWPHPSLRLLLDGSVIEAFIGSREALTSRVYTLNPDNTELEVTYSGKGHAQLEAWPLKAISADRLAI